MAYAVRSVAELLRAERCAARPMPKANNIYKRQGLAFERKVAKALAVAAASVGAELELQPWFRYYDRLGQGQAVPDFLLHFGIETLVIECKLTWVPEAVTKLRGLYVPVVQQVLGSVIRVRPLVICKHLIPLAGHIVPGLRDALGITHSVVPTLQWLGVGPILWHA